MIRTQRAVILPVVLFVLLLVGLFAARFSFQVNADLSSTQALVYKLQTRLAAEAGVEYVKMLLREDQLDMSRWYDNPELLHRIIVWSPDGQENVWGSNQELDEGAMAYRFSVVADDPSDDENFMRFGVTDESAKVNLNVATERQLRILLEAAAGDDESIVVQEIVDAIMDWRDVDSDPRGEEGDTEGVYYLSLPKPYRVKNGPFDTVEELLLVKGVTARLLYGEDIDRNGLLTENEDDGESSFPPDNQDGRLGQGLFPYLTTVSYERNVSNDRRPRVNLLGSADAIREQLGADFEDDPGMIDFLIVATRRAVTSTAPLGHQRNPGQLGGGGTGNTGNQPDGSQAPKKSGPRQQVRQAGQADPPSDTDPPADAGNDDGADGVPEDAGEPVGESDPVGDQGNPSGDQESGGGGSAGKPIRSPASLLGDQVANDHSVVPSRLRKEDMPLLMDRATTVPPTQERLEGLINVNTAPVPVLRCIEGLTEDQIDLLVAVRAGLEAKGKATTAWLLVEDVVDETTFETVAPQITARGQQFTIEVLGYGDHVGAVTRLQVVVDMVGPIPQTIYYRDISYLGANFPIREEDLREAQRVR